MGFYWFKKIARAQVRRFESADQFLSHERPHKGTGAKIAAFHFDMRPDNTTHIPEMILSRDTP